MAKEKSKKILPKKQSNPKKVVREIGKNEIKKPNYFYDLLDSIYQTKKDLFYGEHAKQYNPVIAQLMIGNNPRTIFDANEVNSRSNLPPRLHYLYLLHSIKKDKYYNKYPKKNEAFEKDISNISEYYSLSKRGAKKIFSVHNREEIDKIAKYIEMKYKHITGEVYEKQL